MANVDMCEHEWPGSGCKECFPLEEAETDREMMQLTGEWVPYLPKAYEKSVVLGGGRVLYPCHDPATTAAVLQEHILEVARRSYRAGKSEGKAEIRKALFE